MWKTLIHIAAAVLLATNLQSLEAAAEPRDPKQAVQEIAELTADMTQFATILRLSEDLAFWQGVAIMGALNDWEFSKGAEETGIWTWAYRLGNSLDKSLYDGSQASLAIARSRALTADEKQAGKDLFAKLEKMQVLSKEMFRLLKEDNITAASALYESDVLQLRRDISGAAASSATMLRDRVKRIALDIRLGK